MISQLSESMTTLSLTREMAAGTGSPDFQNKFDREKKAENGFFRGARRSKDQTSPVRPFPAADILVFPDVVSAPHGPRAKEVVKLRNSGAKVYFIGYDMLPATYPQYFRRYSQAVFREWLRAALSSDGIIFISEYSRKEFYRLHPEVVPSESKNFRTTVIHLASEPPPQIAHAASTRAPLNGRDSFVFLMVGTIEPRKGHQSVLRAFEILWKKGHKHTLTIVGGSGWLSVDLEKQIRHHTELGHHLFFLDHAGDDVLWQHYLQADALIANSEAEGFGLPLVEAASVGLPIIARRIEPFIEIAQDHAFYLDSGDAEHIAAALQRWCALATKGHIPDSRKIPVRTWTKVAEDTMSFLLNT